ncbi:protein phosphatase 2C 51 [Sesamum alatum]|uniref:protein-serine/threonine phosphatase n=1 Tax=Sesamum alatum TaxID=300844 RepID=A0AAE1YT52_9LAMI|nr:protein phosphatase 2C 51 [Sesamum alatum]
MELNISLYYSMIHRTESVDARSSLHVSAPPIVRRRRVASLRLRIREQQSPPEPEGSFRRRGAWLGSKDGETKLSGEGSEIAKDVRRRRMELRRMRTVCEAKSAGDPSCDGVCVKKKRAEIQIETKVIENGFMDTGNAGRGVTRTSQYGKISIIGRRREMEDVVAVELGFLKRGGKSYDFFGVYDGHGGWRVAQACGQMLHKLLAKIVEEESSGDDIDWEKVMAAGFKQMDAEVNKNGAAVATMGSTAVVAVVGENEVVVANCGDSRAVLSRGGVAVQLSDDHKPDRPDELERIEACGGRVVNWNGQRVLGVLATSRSIGDSYLKPFVTTEPEVKIIHRTHADECLILASDGLWDVVSNDYACQVARRCLHGWMKPSCRSSGAEGATGGDANAAEAAVLLAELAMSGGSRDNISVVVVKLGQ